MVCGTASDVGKTQVVAGLCRLLAGMGVRVAPFKAQNMALNSFVTSDGGEIGRAQAAQAMAARVEPEVAMNPILLKPTGERTSQVIVCGVPWRDLDAVAYHEAKKELIDVVEECLDDLRRRFDVVILEGAGSPAEINLLDGDLVNLGLAVRASIPAVIVGDIDRGGVFAALFGTVMLLPADLRECVRGFVINKFRGDPALLGDALSDLERRCGVGTFGVLPFVPDVALDAEDSLALAQRRSRPDAVTDVLSSPHDVLDVAVIRFPHLSNFTDLDAFDIEPAVSVRFVGSPAELGSPDLVVLPGTKATMEDLAWFRRTGFASELSRLRFDDDGAPRVRSPAVLGLCGGYQMLGSSIEDPFGVEGASEATAGLGFLDVHTVFEIDKCTRQRTGSTSWHPEESVQAASHAVGTEGVRAKRAANERWRARADSGAAVSVAGYEIHHGRVHLGEGATPWLALGESAGLEREGVVDHALGVFGTCLHGLFEGDDVRAEFLGMVARRRGKRWNASGVSFARARDDQLDRLADLCREHLDLPRLWTVVGEGARSTDLDRRRGGERLP